MIILDQEIGKIMHLLENELEVNIYLFGSFLVKREANDIDLLILYGDISHHKVNGLKYDISVILQEKFHLPVHFTTLSREEVEDIKEINLNKFHLVF